MWRALSKLILAAGGRAPARRSRKVALRALFFAALSALTFLPEAPAQAQQGCFLFFCPPGVVPQAPRNRRPWWAPAEPQRQAPPPQQTRRREPPPEPEGVVYSSAEAATQGKRQAPSEFVLVLGDRLSGQLAQGLADAYVSDRAKMAIIADTVDESGYLPTPVDWIGRFPAAVAEAKPSAVVVALGSDDLQPIPDGAFTAEPLTDRWMELYARRVDDVMTSLRAHAGRVIVVGVAPVANTGLSDEYRRLNELLRSRASRAGFAFVDVWDGFVDEDGKFLTFGPAVDGQRRRLRLSDGVRFTRAGSRKLAFFVQKDLDRMLADPTKPSSGLAGAGPDRALTLAGAPKDTAAAPTSVALSGSAEGKAAARALVEGVPPAPRRGRADDFSWPPPEDTQAVSPAPAAAAPAVPAPDAN